MKKNGFLMMMLLAICGCADDREAALEQATVRMSFYQMEAMTRTATPIGEVCSQLDVWVINGTDTISIHQQSTDADFGTVGLTLDKTLTYKLVAIAHKSADAAVLADGVIRFADEKVTHSMIYTTAFSPATTTDMSCTMQRIVGMFRLETTDAVPDEVKQIKFTIPATGTRWDIAGHAANSTERETTIAITSTRQDGTVALSIYMMAEDLTTTSAKEITVQTLTAQGTVTNSRTFHEVPIKAGYKTTYRGNLFVSTQTAGSFMVGAWSEFDVTEF